MLSERVCLIRVRFTLYPLINSHSDKQFINKHGKQLNFKSDLSRYYFPVHYKHQLF